MNRISCKSWSLIAHRPTLANNLKTSLSFKQSRYSSSDKPSLPGVVETKNGIIVCWHPPQQFPYECTKPIPLNKRLQSEDSAIKVQISKDLELLRAPQPQVQAMGQLQRLTHTHKDIWFSRGRRGKIRFAENHRDGI